MYIDKLELNFKPRFLALPLCSIGYHKVLYGVVLDVMCCFIVVLVVCCVVLAVCLCV